MVLMPVGAAADRDGMKLSPPPFKVVANGYAPAEVDAFVLALARRARGDVAELRTRIEDLEAELARHQATGSSVQEPTPIPVEEPAVPSADWALAAVGRSPYESWSDEQRRQAIVSLRSRRLSACS